MLQRGKGKKRMNRNGKINWFVLVCAFLITGCSWTKQFLWMDGDSGTKESLPIGISELIEMASYCNDAYETRPKHYQIRDNELSYTVKYDEGVTIISFRGTDNGWNILSDIDVRPWRDDELGLILHRGFKDTAGYLFSDIRKNYRLDNVVLLTGHSLGGAIAQIIGLWLDEQGHVVQIYTFGSPKVSTTFLGNEPPHYRVVIGSDPVPFLPPYPYVHSGIRIDAKTLNWNESDDYGEFTEVNDNHHSMQEYLNILKRHAPATRPTTTNLKGT